MYNTVVLKKQNILLFSSIASFYNMSRLLHSYTTMVPKTIKSFSFGFSVNCQQLVLAMLKEVQICFIVNFSLYFNH